MTSKPAETWRERTIGCDRALVKDLGAATMVFARGPAIGEPDRSRRLSGIIDSLPGALESISHCRQIHGAAIHRLCGDTNGVERVGNGDGLVTDRPGHGALVWTADCVPVLIAGADVVAAVHSGWRGSAADIVGAAVEVLETTFGAAPRTLRAALGPAVCGRCYRVGPEVCAALGAFGLDEDRWRDGDHVDLRGFLAARLEALGVPPGEIETVGGCTAETPDLASYRRDGDAAGRQWSMIVVNR